MGVKRKQVATGRRKKPTTLSAAIFFTAAMMVIWTSSIAQGKPPSLFETDRSTVAIDAGHGGRDLGGRGTASAVEKEVCLELARQLTHLMEPTYRIILTRSDDYDIALQERTAIANHHQAALFISIHTAASYLHSTNGICIYYYQPAGRMPAGPVAEQSAIAWNHIQMAHLTASRELATTLKSALAMLPGQPTAKVMQAPLVVLQGADMPAVAIEVGYLTHPSTEKALKSPEFQTAIARAIAKGIDIYLATKP